MNDKIQQLISNNFLSMLPQGKLEKNISMDLFYNLYNLLILFTLLNHYISYA